MGYPIHSNTKVVQIAKSQADARACSRSWSDFGGRPALHCGSCTARKQMSSLQAQLSATPKVFHANASARYCSRPIGPLASDPLRLQKRNQCPETAYVSEISIERTLTQSKKVSVSEFHVMNCTTAIITGIRDSHQITLVTRLENKTRPALLRDPTPWNGVKNRLE